MADGKRVRGLPIFFGGVAFSLIFAWPLLVAVQSFTWPQATFDAPGPDVLIAQRLVALAPDVALEQGIYPDPIIPSDKGRDCYSAIQVSSVGKNKTSENAVSAIHWFRNIHDNRFIEQIEISSLRSLPRPLLGALGGCINGSLASYFCKQYSNSIIYDAVSREKGHILANYANNALALQKMACILADGITRNSLR